MLKIAALILLALAACSKRQASKGFDPDTYNYLTFNDADSLDPQYEYDSASEMVIHNIYEQLFWFEGGSTEKMTPLLATKVPSRENGLISADGRTYTIPIRKGVKFHDGSEMTPEDVRYSLMRAMLSDREAGPASLLMQPLLGYPATRDDKGKLNLNAYKDAARAVTVEADNVVLRLPKPFAPMLSILAAVPNACVVPKKWLAAHGDWDGTEANWAKFNNPQKQTSPIYEQADGTGPFKLVRWDRATKETVLERNDGYWRAPAKLKRIVIKSVDEFNARKLALQAGDADSIYADREVRSQVDNIPGVVVLDDLPTMEMNPMLYFTFHMNAQGNPYTGSGKLDGDGIPEDFFSDIEVRKGFAYAFDYEGFIRDVDRNKAIQATGFVPYSLPGHNPDQKKYEYDPGKAAEHFKKAFGGQVWEKGFRFTMLFNTSNQPRQSLCQILKHGIEALNPKFRIDVRPIDWPAFLDAQQAHKLPVFILGWNADYPDAHNFAFPIMHSKGMYPFDQHYANAEADKLIDAAVYESNPAKRKKLYARVQEIEYEDVPNLVIHDGTRLRVQRDWVKGFVPNPIYCDPPYGTCFYTIYKSTATEAAGK